MILSITNHLLPFWIFILLLMCDLAKSINEYPRSLVAWGPKSLCDPRQPYYVITDGLQILGTNNVYSTSASQVVTQAWHLGYTWYFLPFWSIPVFKGNHNTQEHHSACLELIPALTRKMIHRNVFQAMKNIWIQEFRHGKSEILVGLYTRLTPQLMFIYS